jgi:2-amino-4-hydroxy-6-hydroxymethyldihydropteridine diphosphokinase
MAIALAAFGSNLGDRAATLHGAVEQLGQTAGVKLLAVSRWHETLPAGGPIGQDRFLNGAALLETTLTPLELLRVFQQVEQAADRRREITWGPRTLDIDLLLYDNQVLDSPELTIPHPRMMFRRFVIEPAAEIAPMLIHPLLGWRLEEIKNHLALARNYIALFAPPGYSTAELAQQIHDSISSQVIHDTLAPTASAVYEGHAASLLATVQRQANLMSRTRWGEAGLAKDELLISDFWLGQTSVEAASWLPGHDARRVQSAWQAALSGTICPKLVVCLTVGNCNPTEISAQKTPLLPAPPDSRPCGIPLNREQLDQWAAAAFELLAGGSSGPWLMVDLNNPTAALTEVAAAALAMR